MPDLKLRIKNCYHCPFKTEYNGWPKDYWTCDQAPGRIIPSKYLKEETVGEPWFCPWRNKPRRNDGVHVPSNPDGSLPHPNKQERSFGSLLKPKEPREPTVEESVFAGLTYYKQFQVYRLAIKYWFQGDDWKFAKEYALSLIVGWKR